MGEDMLKIDIEPIRGILFIRLSGKLNKKSIPKLKKEVVRLLKKVKIKNIVLNIKNLEYIDAYGRNAIIDSLRVCDFNKGKSKICLNEIQKKAINLDGFKFFKMINDELKAFDLINS